MAPDVNELLACIPGSEDRDVAKELADSEPPALRRFHVVARHHTSPVKEDVIEAPDASQVKVLFAKKHGIGDPDFTAAITEIKP